MSSYQESSEDPISQVDSDQNDDKKQVNSELDEFEYVISAENSERSQSDEAKDERSFLKYKHKIKKSFNSPKQLNRLAEHMAR